MMRTKGCKRDRERERDTSIWIHMGCKSNNNKHTGTHTRDANIVGMVIHKITKLRGNMLVAVFAPGREQQQQSESVSEWMNEWERTRSSSGRVQWTLARLMVSCVCVLGNALRTIQILSGNWEFRKIKILANFVQLWFLGIPCPVPTFGRDCIH